MAKNKKKHCDKKGSNAMKTIWRIEKASNYLLDEALDKLDDCITKKKLVVEKANN